MVAWMNALAGLGGGDQEMMYEECMVTGLGAAREIGAADAFAP